MSDDKLTKLIRRAVKGEIKPLHSEIAVLTREVRDSKVDSLRTSVEVRKNTKELARIDSSIETLTEKIEELSDKSDAALVDIHQLQEESKGIWVKLDVIDEKTDRKIREVREDLGLQAS